LAQHFSPQGFRAQDFDVSAVAQDVEDELAVVGIGEFEDVVAGFESAALVGMPAFGGDPAGALRGKRSGAGSWRSTTRAFDRSISCGYDEK
jgi:hypothetical protein